MYITKEKRDCLLSCFLIEIMPHFPYSANRIELIHLAWPSIMYLPSMLHPSTINPFTTKFEERATALLLVINYDSPQYRHYILRLWRHYSSANHDVLCDACIGHTSNEIYDEKIFLKWHSFTHACFSRECFESAIKRSVLFSWSSCTVYVSFFFLEHRRKKEKRWIVQKIQLKKTKPVVARDLFRKHCICSLKRRIATIGRNPREWTAGALISDSSDRAMIHW